MLEWSVERGRLGGLGVLPLAPLEEAVQQLLAQVGIPGDAARGVMRLVREHPLALRLAIEAQVGDVSADETLSRVVGALAAAFRDGLDDQSRKGCRRGGGPTSGHEGAARGDAWRGE